MRALAEEMDEEARTYAQLAEEAEAALQAQKQAFERQLKALQEQVAASIIDHIRQAALGEALVPFEERVASAMQGIYASRPWAPVQRKWLERLAKQLAFEVIIDRRFVNTRFADKGGAKQLDKVLGNQLDEVLDGIADHLWRQPA